MKAFIIYIAIAACLSFACAGIEQLPKNPLNAILLWLFAVAFGHLANHARYWNLK